MGARGTVWVFLLMLSGVLPWAIAWHANRRTTLRPTLAWALAAWVAWCTTCYQETFAPNLSDAALQWLALSLTASAGVAILGARRPGLDAWNFVVASLLLILLLPFVPASGRFHPSNPGLLLLAGTLAIALLNYLRTRLGLLAAAVAFACWRQLADLNAPEGGSPHSGIVFLSLGAAPWLGWACWGLGRKYDSEFTRTWREFRDRFGWFWAERLREQFNRAAANADWQVKLGWRGLEKADGEAGPDEADVLVKLQALLKRFAGKGAAAPGD